VNLVHVSCALTAFHPGVNDAGHYASEKTAFSKGFLFACFLVVGMGRVYNACLVATPAYFSLSDKLDVPYMCIAVLSEFVIEDSLSICDCSKLSPFSTCPISADTSMDHAMR